VLYAVTLAFSDRAWLPLVFVVWANLHGGWILGLGAVAVQALLRPSRQRVMLATACGAATLVNPYGVHVWIAILDAMRRGWAEVSEWAPIWWSSVGVAPLLLWVGLLGIVVGLARAVRADRTAWVWTALTLVAAAKSRRLLALAAITIVLTLVGAWQTTEDRSRVPPPAPCYCSAFC